MTEAITLWFENLFVGFPPWIAVFVLSMIPVIELKGAIPIGVAAGMPLWEAFSFAVIGSTLPAFLIILLIRPVLKWMKTTKYFRKFAHWLERRSQKKSKNIQKYKLWGLFLFVAIPLPTTGVWMGSLIAALMDIRLRSAVPIIFLGNLVAGGLILLLSHGIFG
ncbi:Predicted membrane protein [uncultured Clostridium sp.]|nr:Predicted membrane protein [uncultured Clostridium sp.]